jgi:LSD1 subclass zinc finger protein
MMTTPTPNTFSCPSCGGPLQVVVNAKSMRCKYCNNSVVIPKELRERSKDPSTIVAGYKPFF